MCIRDSCCTVCCACAGACPAWRGTGAYVNRLEGMPRACSAKISFCACACRIRSVFAGPGADVLFGAAGCQGVRERLGARTMLTMVPVCSLAVTAWLVACARFLFSPSPKPFPQHRMPLAVLRGSFGGRRFGCEGLVRAWASHFSCAIVCVLRVGAPSIQGWLRCQFAGRHARFSGRRAPS